MTTTSLADIPCTVLKGVGAKMAEKLSQWGVTSIQDLLFLLPYRYQDRTHISPIGNLRHGDYAVIDGTVDAISVNKFRRPTLSVTLSDASGSITLRFFHFTAQQRNALTEGMQLRCFGEVREAYRGLEIAHPEYRRVSEHEPMPVEETLTPIYPSTQGLHQLTVRKLTEQVLVYLEKSSGMPELLPESVCQALRFPELNDALLFVHRPPPNVAVSQLLAGEHPAISRLAFEELLAHHMSMRRLRLQAQSVPAPKLENQGTLTTDFLKQLNFELTGAQNRVCQEIFNDLEKAYPMMRLVQGDVGSGKTVVAALALLRAVANGFQAALMAPTDILAEQHYRTLQTWFEPLGIQIGWLAGKHKGKKRQSILEDIALGNAQVIVGTHALFQADVDFKNLSLVVIDEQHRFGVHQRMALRDKGRNDEQHPHQLIMTATPIPRTLAMTAYADLDVSIIDELPPGRTPVKTVVLPNNKRNEVIQRIHEACSDGKQAYWVCTLVEESEVLQCQAAEVTQKELQQALPDLRIGLVHGKLKPAEKEAMMQAFKTHELDLLVATTVIEVGVDVPNSSLMIIENAERLGLSQLHQLRGRVGRGAVASFCVLMYQSPLSNTAKSRLQVMRDSNDGFVIARKDLEIRGPGELLGTKQTGMLQFKIADLKRDQALLEQVHRFASEMAKQPQEIIDALIRRWLGNKEDYAGV